MQAWVQPAKVSLEEINVVTNTILHPSIFPMATLAVAGFDVDGHAESRLALGQSVVLAGQPLPNYHLMGRSPPAMPPSRCTPKYQDGVASPAL
jgi:hypothetical protein